MSDHNEYMPYADKKKAQEYNKKYHLRTWAKRKAGHLVWRRKRRAMLATWLKNYKKDLFCVKCNENHPACLDFHHLNGQEKDNPIANMISEGYSIENITKEINKCIILCRNCHAKVHYQINNSSQI